LLKSRSFSPRGGLGIVKSALRLAGRYELKIAA
jgi:hypothetical protein